MVSNRLIKSLTACRQNASREFDTESYNNFIIQLNETHDQILIINYQDHKSIMAHFAMHPIIYGALCTR